MMNFQRGIETSLNAEEKTDFNWLASGHSRREELWFDITFLIAFHIAKGFFALTADIRNSLLREAM